MKYFLVYICVGVFMISGCHRSKKLDDTTSLVERSEAEIHEALYAHNIDAQWYAIKGSARVSMPDQSFSGSVYLRIKRDSIIWGMAKKLSIEGGRFLSTPEQTTLINRIDRTYMNQSTPSLLGSLDTYMEFRDFQELLMGNIILPDSISRIEEDGIYYAVRFISGDIDVSYWIDSKSTKLSHAEYLWKDGKKVHVLYTDYMQVDSFGDHARQRSISIYNKGQQHTSIDLKLSDIQVDVPKKTPFQVPRRYERIDKI